MERVLIVDGYNMIGAWPELTALAEHRLEDARDRLIEMLADYQAFTGMKVILVFDAHQVPGLGGKYRHYQVDVRYTKEKETADECIERLVSSRVGKRREVYVATSDYTEQRVTFGQGALRISARELLIEVRESRKKISTSLREQSDTRRNPFDGKMSDELREIMEKWRRGK